MSEAADKLWKDTWERWSASNSISRYSWASVNLVRDHPGLEERIFNGLTNDNPFLVANCVAALEAMERAAVAQAVAEGDAPAADAQEVELQASLQRGAVSGIVSEGARQSAGHRFTRGEGEATFAMRCRTWRRPTSA